MAGDSLFNSPANTITLTGRGQIVFSETLYDDGSDRPATGAILGGTGEFLGATGYVVSRSLRGSGDFVITISEYMQRDFDRSFPLILEALGL